MQIRPDTRFPGLTYQTVGSGSIDIHQRAPSSFTLLIVYRGHHCPLCKKQLQDFERLMDDFSAQGIELLPVSANSRELAAQSAQEWGLERLSLGYGLSKDDARRLGLFISTAIKDTEPEWFTEPALFLIRPDGTLYASVVQTMPFSRPTGEQLLSSLSFIVEKGYPARGTGSLD